MNADETGLFWKALPEKSHSVTWKKCKGGKQSKEGLKITFLTNTFGQKEPLIIFRSKNPRCFKKLKDKKRPAESSYYATVSSWMDCEIMKIILRKLNSRIAAQKRNILLFLGNTPSHPGYFANDDLLSYIEGSFLPNNTTSK